MTSTFDPAVLEPLLKRLGLSTTAQVFPEMAVQAEKESWSYGTFLERLLAEEVARRTETRIAQLMTRARFPSTRLSKRSTFLSAQTSSARCWAVFSVQSW